MSRPLQAFIDSAALRRNLHRARELAPGCRVMAVIKSDGYGHGLLRVAEALRAADGFGIVRVEDAAAIRDSGYDGQILLLEGMYGADELGEIARVGAVVVLHHEEQLRMLERSPLHAPIRVWLKFDTGMHRIGFRPAEAARLIDRLTRLPGVHLDGAMSHLASADDPSDPSTAEQIACFASIELPPGCSRSLANSAGLVAWPDSRLDWVRPGIMLYGSSPLTGVAATVQGLAPVMRLRSQLIAVRPLKSGEAVGYGGAFRCPEDMMIGVVACGYGDGYPRHVPCGTPVWVDGRRVPLVGKVSMGMLSVDLRAAPQAGVGAPVELWGGHVHVDEIAAAAGTVSYELMCRVSASVPRVEGTGGD
jgi:alanine racemase